MVGWGCGLLSTPRQHGAGHAHAGQLAGRAGACCPKAQALLGMPEPLQPSQHGMLPDPLSTGVPPSCIRCGLNGKAVLSEHYEKGEERTTQMNLNDLEAKKYIY